MTEICTTKVETDAQRETLDIFQEIQSTYKDDGISYEGKGESQCDVKIKKNPNKCSKDQCKIKVDDADRLCSLLVQESTGAKVIARKDNSQCLKPMQNKGKAIKVNI